MLLAKAFSSNIGDEYAGLNVCTFIEYPIHSSSPVEVGSKPVSGGVLFIIMYHK